MQGGKAHGHDGVCPLGQQQANAKTPIRDEIMVFSGLVLDMRIDDNRQHSLTTKR